MSYDMSMPFPLIVGIARGREKWGGINLGMINGFWTYISGARRWYDTIRSY